MRKARNLAKIAARQTPKIALFRRWPSGAAGRRRDRAEHVPQCAYSAVSDHRTLARIGAQKSRYFLRNNAPKVVYFVRPVLSILCARHVPGL
jgi:hypothetical protein